jgi:hypothetical protein
MRQSSCTIVLAELDKKCPALCGIVRTPRPCQGVPESLSLEVKWPGREAYDSRTVQRLRIRGAFPPLPLIHLSRVA